MWDPAGIPRPVPMRVSLSAARLGKRGVQSAGPSPGQRRRLNWRHTLFVHVVFTGLPNATQRLSLFNDLKWSHPDNGLNDLSIGLNDDVFLSTIPTTSHQPNWKENIFGDIIFSI